MASAFGKTYSESIETEAGLYCQPCSKMGEESVIGKFTKCVWLK